MTSVFRAAASSIVLNETSQTSAVALEEAQNRRIAAMRERKEARRQRFLNARERSIGIDAEFLERQRREHIEAARREKAADLKYARDQAAIDRALENFELQVKAQRKEQAERTKQEWQRQIAMKKFNPDFELNDPDALKKQLPARVGDSDPRLGPASLQVFDGEDLRAAERRELQHKQMKDWCLEENIIKRTAKIRELEEDYEYRRYLESVEEMRKKADEAIAAERRAEVDATKAANAALAAERAALQKKMKEDEEKSNQQELKLALTSGILKEDVADAQSALGAGRIRPDHFRGMSAEQVAAFRAAQEEQRRAVARRKEAEKKADREDARRQNELLRAAARIEAAQAEQQRIAKAQYKAALEQQRATARARAERERQEARQSGFTDGFFGGFGQSDR